MLESKKITNTDIKKFAEELADANTIIWNAICCAEHLMKSNVYMKTRNTFDGERQKILKRIAIAYKNVEHNDESFAEPEMNES